MSTVLKFLRYNAADGAMRMHTVYLHLLASDSRRYSKFERVYIRLYIIEMPLLIENPADCEIRSVIRYLSAKGVKAPYRHTTTI